VLAVIAGRRVFQSPSFVLDADAWFTVSKGVTLLIQLQVDDMDVYKIGPKFEKNIVFPAKTNTEVGYKAERFPEVHIPFS
jgi:hypothetical protein